jgi:hypothetical protein
VTIGGTNGAYIVTFDVSTATISSLTIEGGNGTNHVTTLRMTAGATLSIQGGLTLFKKDSPAAIDGAGTISVGGAITFGGTGAEGTITAGTDTTGGVLELTGAGFVSSPFTFVIGTVQPSTLNFNLAGGVSLATAIAINNANQTLEIGQFGILSPIFEEHALLGGKFFGGEPVPVLAPQLGASPERREPSSTS